MVDVIKSWTIKSSHEFDEYTSRSAQLTRVLDGEIPRGVAVLERMLHTLEKYSDLATQTIVDDLYSKAMAADSQNEDVDGTNGEQAADFNQQPGSEDAPAEIQNTEDADS